MGCVGAGARGAVRQSCFRPRKPARKKGSARVSYRATLDVPIATVRTISGWLTAHRRAYDIRPHQRACTTWGQAILVLRWLKDGTGCADPGPRRRGLAGHRLPLPARGLGGGRPTIPRDHLPDS